MCLVEERKEVEPYEGTGGLIHICRETKERVDEQTKQNQPSGDIEKDEKLEDDVAEEQEIDDDIAEEDDEEVEAELKADQDEKENKRSSNGAKKSEPEAKKAKTGVSIGDELPEFELETDESTEEKPDKLSTKVQGTTTFEIKVMCFKRNLNLFGYNLDNILQT